MSDSIGHDATPHPRDASHNNHANNSDSDSDNVSTPPFLSRPHTRLSNSAATARTESLTATTTTTTTTSSATTKSREALRSSGFGHTRSTKESKSSSSKSKHSSGTAAFHGEDSDNDSEDSDNEKKGVGRGRKKSGSRKRRFSDSASHLLAQAPPIPDLRFDNNYRKALNQIYEAHANESALAAAGSTSTTTLDASTTDEKKPTSGALQQTQQGGKRVPSIAARVTVMTLRDIIIMPFIHGFFWGFGTILLTLVGQRSLVYHVQRTWRQIFGGNPDEVVNASRGQPARVRRIGGGGGGFGLGGIGLSNAGSAGVGTGGFARPGHVY
ncbi:hypothetical protein KI688_003836 [Linnemannia hyalina]|uniref:Uncharacterized protein n=1 Tax=Linnemannia hyalina TaxID=64524 RepID=A0A9P7XM26_9FUNG|nr:hypothetical protein KI688_003836 [Linnemannia hyalina]